VDEKKKREKEMERSGRYDGGGGRRCALFSREKKRTQHTQLNLLVVVDVVCRLYFSIVDCKYRKHQRQYNKKKKKITKTVNNNICLDPALGKRRLEWSC